MKRHEVCYVFEMIIYVFFLIELPALDGMPYYVLDIVNLEINDNTLNRYYAVWKPSRHLSFEQMEAKLNVSKEVPVLVALEFHRIESVDTPRNGGFAILLQDFTTTIDPLSRCLEMDADEGEPGESAVPVEIENEQNVDMEIG